MWSKNVTCEPPPCSFDWNIHLTWGFLFSDIRSAGGRSFIRKMAPFQHHCHFSGLIFIANQHDPVAFGFDPSWHRDTFSSFKLPVTLPTFHVYPSEGHRKWVFHGREWAGVCGVQPAGQGPEVEGRIQRNGLLPGRSVSVCNSLRALFFCSLLVVRTVKSRSCSLSSDENEEAHRDFSWFPLHRRAVAQRCPSPPMKNLISVGGQHQGIYCHIWRTNTEYSSAVHLTSLSYHIE